MPWWWVCPEKLLNKNSLVSKRIYLSPPHMGGDEMKFVQDTFESNWVAPTGPHLSAFENELAAYNEVPHCAALSSGTAAIHLALIVLGVQRNDEVICSSFTFAGSCNPIVYLGATPVFVDSERDTWNMDPDALETAIRERIKNGKRPKAIIMVHLYGMPGKIREIMEVAARYGIPVIEDAAEALGSTLDGKKLGSFGDFGIYSFNGNKIITTSGGGALVSANADWVKKARFLATQARDEAPHYQHTEVGYNYRLSNVCAAIGRGQLKVIDKRVAQRRTIFEFYKNRFSSIDGISFQPEPPGAVANRWLTCVQIQPEKGFDREAVRLALEKENIESRPLWKPMHLQPVFSTAPFYGAKVCDKLFENGLCLPSGSALTHQELERISGIVSDELQKSINA